MLYKVGPCISRKLSSDIHASDSTDEMTDKSERAGRETEADMTRDNDGCGRLNDAGQMGATPGFSTFDGNYLCFLPHVSPNSLPCLQ